MNKNIIKGILALYATIFTAGFLYGFIREIRKEVASKPTLSYKPSAEFQKLINYYDNKAKDLANAQFKHYITSNKVGYMMFDFIFDWITNLIDSIFKGNTE